MRVLFFVSSAFGTGFIPVAPGTFGSLVGAFSFYLIPPHAVLPITVIAFFASAAVIVGAQKHLTLRDDPRIVLDEVVAIWLIYIFIPPSIFFRALGFVLFRFFDVAKTPGVKKLQAIPGAWGVMLDDILAGIYTIFCINAIIFLVQRAQHILTFV